MVTRTSHDAADYLKKAEITFDLTSLSLTAGQKVKGLLKCDQGFLDLANV